ncbi:RelA/SpoT family protein [Trueperella bialowiezensis]|uniref:Bifunctional (P)ppGpp synthase/hydrolase relA n=1 Tax=Trueperella bialowiezensis TaxID=312285 RepID=A0A448PBY2_9ACTO|nr:bifunctional (p)ppGpp synthetase/guanosine-3',5'-bis(diphosphate) 3'-pyrophosphohydrolase [Trueperella bialowiezensis]VEI12475.1 Bifunctional (p)ppGpp synthase/hydrolase relA [Trueperella bialowiezensis]
MDTTSHADPEPRIRSRLSWLGRRNDIPPLLEPLMRAIGDRKVDKARIVRAYEIAERYHKGQMRKSGEPYITHPVAVATILAELTVDDDTLVAALLHDTVEDTDYSLKQLTKDFGETVALLVDGVTKLDKVEYGEAAQAETVRKMVIAMAKDIRVLLIKLCDRLHNARTWKYVEPGSARRKARETLEIYAPLAHRLGMNSIKWELEDRSFNQLYPAVYSEIERMVQDRAPERERYIAQMKVELERELAKAKIKCTISGRPKHYYSIYQKMILRGRDFEDIYDLIGVRVLVDEVQDCYTALGIANSLYVPVQGRIKDYIASPKFNLYQSIHTTVLGPGSKTVEIQIRTYDMHKRAEFGVAAHWRYKENPNAAKPDEAAQADTQLEWLRQLVDWQRETADPKEFLDSLRYEMSGSQVYVFTPMGEVMELPSGSTPVDFAYAVHTEVGHRTVGAKVNDKLVTLDHRLESGDTVEIITTKAEDAGPSQGWQEFVVTGRAKSKIRTWFTKSRREEAIEQGKEKLAKAIRRRNEPVQRLMSHETLKAVAQDLSRSDVSELYAAIGEGTISAETVVRRLISSQGGRAGVEETMAEAVTPTRIQHQQVGATSSAVVVSDMEQTDVLVKLAKCCTPVPPDEIVGFVTRGNGISVHRADCRNMRSLRREPERFIDIAWADDAGGNVFLVQIQIEALDRKGLLADITRALAEHDINMLTGSMNTSNERVARLNFTFEMADPHHLQQVLREIRKIEGVYDAYRLTGSEPAESERNSQAAG